MSRDTMFVHSVMDVGPFGVDRERMRGNKERLRELRAGHPEVRLFSAHDPNEFDRMVGG